MAMATTIAHKVYYWVETSIENEYKPWKPKEVAHKHGVPAKELFTYWQKEIDCDRAVQTLPRTLSLIVFFALMLMAHEMVGPAQSIERVIRFDIEENANFAFNGVGTFGNKNVHDVNSFADFYSWMRLGFAAIYLPQTSGVSEGATNISAVALTPPQSLTYLNMNRKLGPVKLSQQMGTATTCANPDLVAKFSDANWGCNEAGSAEFYIQPTDFDVGFATFKEEESKTVWFATHMSPEAQIHRLETTDWLTKDSEHWQLTLVLYNPNYDVLTICGIHFLQSHSGRIWKQITFMSLQMMPYSNWWSLIWEILFFGSILTIFVEELYEVAKGLIEARSNGRCRCMQFLRDYITIWNLVDWMSIIIAFTLLGMWIVTCMDRAELQDHISTLLTACDAGDAEQCNSLQDSLLEAASTAGILAGRTSLVSSFYPFCILLRLFKTFSLQPRLAVVTRTLWASFADLVHFGIIFLSVFITYVFMAMGFFGRTVEGYSQFYVAFVTLFRALMGDLDFEAMQEQAGRIIAGIFHFTFMMTMLLILLNMLIAIIMDVYSETKKSASCSDTVWDDVYDYFERLWQRRSGHRMSIMKAKSIFLESLQAEKEAADEKKDPELRVGNTSWFEDEDVKDSVDIVTIDDLQKRVPEMPPEQVEQSIEEAVDWFERHTEAEIDQQEILQGIRSLQQAAGIDLGVTGLSRNSVAPVDGSKVSQKIQDVAKQHNVKDLLQAIQYRLDAMEMPSRSRDLLAQMIASTRMVQDNQLVDVRL